MARFQFPGDSEARRTVSVSPHSLPGSRGPGPGVALTQEAIRATESADVLSQLPPGHELPRSLAGHGNARLRSNRSSTGAGDPGTARLRPELRAPQEAAVAGTSRAVVLSGPPGGASILLQARSHGPHEFGFPWAVGPTASILPRLCARGHLRSSPRSFHGPRATRPSASSERAGGGGPARGSLPGPVAHGPSSQASGRGRCSEVARIAAAGSCPAGGQLCARPAAMAPSAERRRRGPGLALPHGSLLSGTQARES